MLATAAAKLPVGAEWTYEVKWDGYRTLAVKNGERVTLWSRNLKDATAQYRSVARSIARLRSDSLLLDGEIVALDEQGRPSFQALHHQAAHTLVYYAFDALHVDGADLIRVPAPRASVGTREAPEKQRRPQFRSPAGHSREIERAVRDLRLEGVVAKRRPSLYEPGRRSSSWIKVKFNRRQEFVIGGFKPNALNFESLVVSYYEGRNCLLPAGSVPADAARPIRDLPENRVPTRSTAARSPTCRARSPGTGVKASQRRT